VYAGKRFAGLAFHRLSCEPSAFATGSPFHLKSGGYISDLLALWIPLTMATHLDSSRAQMKPRASKQSDQGTRRSLVYSTLTRSDPSQESSLKVLRKENYKSEEAHAFHNFKRASRIESLSGNTRLLEQKRYVRIQSQTA